MMKHTFRMVLALALLTLTPLALTACGSSDGAATGAPAADEHAGHDHAKHGDHAELAKDAMAMSTDKVDPAGALKAFDAAPKAGDKAICPISGQAFVVTDKTETSEYEGKHYAYCCGGCKPKFDADPAAFTGGAADKPADKPAEG